MYYTYVLRCGDGSLYTGIAADLKKRMREYFGRDKRSARYVLSRGAERLEAFWESEDRGAASRLEYRIKSLPKEKKEELLGNRLTLEELFADKLDCGAYCRGRLDFCEFR